MGKAAVLGAGYMGSAITFPLADNGIKVNLWGTWLDDDILDACKYGQHPKLKKHLPESVSLYNSDRLRDAVKDADIIIIAVTSEGFFSVFNKLLDSIEKEYPIFSFTKGFITHAEKVQRISAGAADIYQQKLPGLNLFWASVGGPVKAVELSNKVPTATVFGINSPEIKGLIEYFPTDYYMISTCNDVKGVELTSAFKNIYAIAIGIYDGLYQATEDRIYHNFKALIFNQAIQEMALLVEKAGGKRKTVFDLAGIGDLYVTSSSGRNRRFGEYIGRNVKPEKAYKIMLDDHETAEGYSTLGLGMTFTKQLGEDLIKDLPLLDMLYRIIFLHNNIKDEVTRFIRLYGQMR